MSATLTFKCTAVSAGTHDEAIKNDKGIVQYEKDGKTPLVKSTPALGAKFELVRNGSEHSGIEFTRNHPAEDRPMTTRCKMLCTKAEPEFAGQTAPDGYIAEFMAVADGSPENEAFFQSTPSATLSLRVTKAQHFEKGKTYYVDLTLAE